MSEFPPPFLPPSVDLRNFPCVMLDICRLRGSEFDAIESDAAWRAGVNLWFSAWHQVPAGSLKASEEQLAKLAGLGRDLRTWRKIKADALHGWILCNDGRLYHRTLCEKALEAWLSKLRQRLKSGKGNESRWGAQFDKVAVEAEQAHALECLKALQTNGVVKSAEPPSRSLSDPPGMPQRSQEKRRDIFLPSEGAPRAETNLTKRAWDLAEHVLATQGRMSPARARSVFGKLLKEFSLPAPELLAALQRCEVEGTRDAVAYMRQAAKGVAERLRERGGLKPSAEARVARWGQDEWRAALAGFREDGQWPDAWGPMPGEPGCLVSLNVQAAFGFAADVIPLRTGGAA